VAFVGIESHDSADPWARVDFVVPVELHGLPDPQDALPTMAGRARLH